MIVIIIIIITITIMTIIIIIIIIIHLYSPVSQWFNSTLQISKCAKS